jgi:hypothetical protein
MLQLNITKKKQEICADKGKQILILLNLKEDGEEDGCVIDDNEDDGIEENNFAALRPA